MNLFLHSVRLVLSDWRNALRISGVLYLIYAIPSLILTLMFPPGRPAGDISAAQALSFAPIGIILAILMFVVFVWLAVAWHRYILLDETPAGQLPAFDQSRILAYAGNSILLALILLVVAVVISMLLSPLIFLGPLVVGIVLPIVVIAVALVIDYRLGLVLPARALAKPLTLREAWEATRGASSTILVLAIVSALAAVVIDIPAFILGTIPGIGGILALLWTLVTGWLKVMVGVSILTTLYGYYVEKRNIPA
jgi:hypothetical protein